MAKLDLRDVTLCAADSANVALAARALNLSMAQCEFAEAVLFSHEAVEGAFRSVRIAPLQSRNDYSNFMLGGFLEHITTPYALVVQWDGYVVDVRAWNEEFRNYDYIGARWTWFEDAMTVGNGGFSLRSQKLLRALRDPRCVVLPGVNEDELICRDYRPLLEREYGIRFAPESVADLFSYERTIPDNPTFGFHGIFNMWRHTEDHEIMPLVDRLHPYSVKSMDYVETVAQYFLLRKFDPLHAFYVRLRATFELPEIIRRLGKVFSDDTLRRCVESCEKLVGQPPPAAELLAPYLDASAAQRTAPPPQATPGRNDLCPCGSGKKFKHCHGQLV